MNKYEKDINGDDILLSSNKHQIMMEWEKPYMEQSIDFMQPFGDVLEIGFGLGYSASQIMKYPISSYTIIECDDNVIEKINKWKETLSNNVPVYIVKGKWQERIQDLDKFDCIYMDDFPLEEINNVHEMIISTQRLNLFIEIVTQRHTKVGSKISFYQTPVDKPCLPESLEVFFDITHKVIDIDIPENCNYRDVSKQQCLIPLLVKNKEYDRHIENEYIKKKIFGN